MKQAYLEAITQAVIDGDDESAKGATWDALGAGIDLFAILNQGLMSGADLVGRKFESGEFFLPDLMLAGNAMRSAMAILEPVLKERYASGELGQKKMGVVVIATIQTDIHDIGKNIVSSMFTATGFQVHDLGVDVPLKTIAAKAREFEADIIACSALLTTSLPFMRDLVNLLVALGERERYTVIMGGAAVTQAFVDEIGADGYENNAIKAAQLAQKLIEKKRQEKGV